MNDASDIIELNGIVGQCGDRQVFIGFAPASTLYGLSFSDVLNEETGKGYQRKFSREHSLEFRRYIQQPGSTTIPLTFNLRPNSKGGWAIVRRDSGESVLRLCRNAEKVLAQVDCQHRLGFLSDIQVPLTFMAFLGLSVAEEMEIFSTINGKAKGLTSSLLDFHEAKLTSDIAAAKPELFIALRLNELEASPWFKRLDLGGDRTVGLRRYASLRTMQKAVKRFLKTAYGQELPEPEIALGQVLAFWSAVVQVFDREWKDQRRHLVTKGVGVYSLMSLAGDLVREGAAAGLACDVDYFAGALSDFAQDVDWSNEGPMKGFGGAGGADQALSLLREARRRRRMRLHARG